MFNRPRIIPVLLMDDRDLIKTINFKDRTYLGDPVNAVKIFNRKGIDELAVLDGGKCILQLRGVRPFLSAKYDITKHPQYKNLSDFDEKNLFSIEKFLSTELKPKPTEAYDLYEVDASDVPMTT